MTLQWQLLDAHEFVFYTRCREFLDGFLAYHQSQPCSIRAHIQYLRFFIELTVGGQRSIDQKQIQQTETLKAHTPNRSLLLDAQQIRWPQASALWASLGLKKAVILHFNTEGFIIQNIWEFLCGYFSHVSWGDAIYQMPWMIFLFSQCWYIIFWPSF